MPKTIVDPVANAMSSLIYNRNAGGPTSTLIGTYVSQGAVFVSTPVTSAGIDAAIDSVLALIFVTAPTVAAHVHVEIDLVGTKLSVRVDEVSRISSAEINSGFGAALVTASRAVFTQAFAAGMQAALGF